MLIDTGPSDSDKNATTIAQSLDLSSVDVVVCVSGDGIIHEFLNGLASRPDALKALRTPICPVAAGSGNALAVNLFGPEKCLDYAYNALVVVKGVQLPFDLCSISQGKEISWAFLAQAFGGESRIFFCFAFFPSSRNFLTELKRRTLDSSESFLFILFSYG